MIAESAEEWGRRQAAAAPPWSDDDWRRVLAVLGLAVAGPTTADDAPDGG